MTWRARLIRWCTSLLGYPLSWLIVVLISATHLAFAWWFQPGLLLHALASLLDAGALVLWGALVWEAPDFRQRVTRWSAVAPTRQARRLVAACPEAFAAPASQCLDLVEHIYQEFAETESRRALDTLTHTLAELAQAHATLHSRAQRFGTQAQKTHMASMLQKHLTSVRTTLQTLQAFSGNLTLLSASSAADERATQELHFINQGLQDVLQEFYDA
ncbi:MAG: hypothetical protein AB7N91_00030 [Candidatus Tectimicrobiota bacterium]